MEGVVVESEVLGKVGRSLEDQDREQMRINLRREEEVTYRHYSILSFSKREGKLTFPSQFYRERDFLFIPELNFLHFYQGWPVQVSGLVLGTAAPYSLTYLLHPLATLVTITLAVTMTTQIPTA